MHLRGNRFSFVVRIIHVCTVVSFLVANLVKRCGVICLPLSKASAPARLEAMGHSDHHLLPSMILNTACKHVEVFSMLMKHEVGRGCILYDTFRILLV
jgi:hypothetical protein